MWDNSERCYGQTTVNYPRYSRRIDLLSAYEAVRGRAFDRGLGEHRLQAGRRNAETAAQAVRAVAPPPEPEPPALAESRLATANSVEFPNRNRRNLQQPHAGLEINHIGRIAANLDGDVVEETNRPL